MEDGLTEEIQRELLNHHISLEDVAKDEEAAPADEDTNPQNDAMISHDEETNLQDANMTPKDESTNPQVEVTDPQDQGLTTHEEGTKQSEDPQDQGTTLQNDDTTLQEDNVEGDPEDEEQRAQENEHEGAPLLPFKNVCLQQGHGVDVHNYKRVVKG